MAPLPYPPAYLSHHLLFFFLILISRLIFVTASGCYYATNNTILASPNYVDPCGTITSTTSPFLNCCATQSNNVCLSSSLCYDPNPVGGAYYISPCTDPTYSAPECPTACSNRVDMNQLDVTYDTQDQLWRCCGTNPNGSSDCSNPTDETFSAPPPNSLSTIYPIISSSSSSSSSSTSSPSIPTSSSTSVSSSSPSSSVRAAPDISIASATATITNPQSSTARTSTISALPTKSVGNGGNSAGGQGFDTSDKVAIILALVIGLPGSIGTIVGAWYAYVAVRRRRVRPGP